ncbi:MAG: hypothetical protein WC549_00415 [Actinomycetota bacterium]
MDKVKKQAQHLYDGFTRIDIDHDEGEEATRLVLKDEIKSDRWEELSDLLFDVGEETKLSQDSTYEFTHEALGLISDATGETGNELREIGYGIEPDVYTSTLTEWLNESNYHVYFLDEAIDNGAKTGFDALAMAQQEAKRQVFDLVLDHLLKK